jgi:probable phosphoglycerate mutase
VSRRLVVEADGGSRGNPGPAGFGAVVRDPVSGTVLAEVAESIGVATNNVAEYRGLIAGLTAAAGLDPSASVEVRMDSKLVVEQMSGRWRVKHPDMVPLALRARDLAAGFTRISYEWIPRSRNSHADRLANEAMDAAARGETWGVDTSGSSSSSDDEEGAPPARTPKPSATGWSAPTTKPTTLLLLRHGETPLSIEKRFAGTGDAPLTERGAAQAEAAAAHLAAWAPGHGGIDAVVTSPLKRTRATADAVARALGADITEEPGFAETDFGEWEGLTFAEVRERAPHLLKAWMGDPDVPPPGGESFAAVARRVAEARDRVLGAHAERTVVVVSHVTPIKTLLRQALLAPPESLYRMHLDVACLSRVDYYADGPSVVHSVNETAHLAGV